MVKEFELFLRCCRAKFLPFVDHVRTLLMQLPLLAGFPGFKCLPTFGEFTAFLNGLVNSAFEQVA
jgi:hypothetical protein